MCESIACRSDAVKDLLNWRYFCPCQYTGGVKHPMSQIHQECVGSGEEARTASKGWAAKRSPFWGLGREDE